MMLFLVATTVGFIIGGITLAIESGEKSGGFRDIASVFTPHLFFLLLLPPIVFEGNVLMFLKFKSF